jgi:hypothetical protein
MDWTAARELKFRSPLRVATSRLHRTGRGHEEIPTDLNETADLWLTLLHFIYAHHGYVGAVRALRRMVVPQVCAEVLTKMHEIRDLPMKPCGHPSVASMLSLRLHSSFKTGCKPVYRLPGKNA